MKGLEALNGDGPMVLGEARCRRVIYGQPTSVSRTEIARYGESPTPGCLCLLQSDHGPMVLIVVAILVVFE